MEEGLIKDAYEAIIKEIQTILTIAYLSAVGIGMLFSYHKYKAFGINIFDYADVFDFLIAPFSDVNILIFSLISLAAVVAFIYFDTILKAKFPNFYYYVSLGSSRKKWYSTFRFIGFSLLVFFYLFIAAEIYGYETKIQVEKQVPIQLRFADNEKVEGILIGKTSDILFLLKENKNVSAIPINALVKEFNVR